MSIKQNILRGLVLSTAVFSIAAAAAGPAAASDRRVLVINETNHDLVNLYASRTGDRYYHEDHLGRAVVAPGQSVVLDLADDSDACSMDIKAVFSDGDKVEKAAFDVCTRSEMRFTGN